MAKGSQRKRCVICRHVANGTQGRYETCDRCGAEMVAVPYPTRRRPVKYGR